MPDVEIRALKSGQTSLTGLLFFSVFEGLRTFVTERQQPRQHSPFEVLVVRSEQLPQALGQP